MVYQPWFFVVKEYGSDTTKLIVCGNHHQPNSMGIDMERVGGFKNDQPNHLINDMSKFYDIIEMITSIIEEYPPSCDPD